MIAVEIEQAVPDLADKPFDARRFPFAYLEAFGRRAVLIKKLRNSDSNRSDLGGLRQTEHILIAVPGSVSEAPQAFGASPVTAWSKADLTQCGEDILLACKFCDLATTADLYHADAGPDDLRAAHERNDEMLECIYIGCRSQNDTERREKLFEMYIKMTAAPPQPAKHKGASR